MRNKKRVLSFLLVLAMLFTMVPATALATEASPANADNFTIVNPYANVNWGAFGQYRAALHMHTTRSDGSASVADTVFDLYNKGFDIIAITDHSDVRYVDNPDIWLPPHDGNWASGYGSMTVSQQNAIRNGSFGRSQYTNFQFPSDFGPGFYRPAAQGGMISIANAHEMSFSEHIITLWANFHDESGWSQAQTLQATTDAGGVAIIAHPGRYTTGAAGGAGGLASSSNPMRLSHYIELFDRFDAALGFELFNRLDNESRSDRVLWDNILQELMPYGRFVWGFSNDDSHSMNQAGYNWNVLLMPTLSETNARQSMEDGAFYMVTRVNRGGGPTDPEVNTVLPDGRRTPNGGNADTAFMLHQTPPGISNIVVSGNTITITGRNYDRIEWIADGAIIATGASIDVSAHANRITTNHVRAQLVSDYGVAYTQPFGVLPPGQSDFQDRPTGNNLASIDSPPAVSVLHGADPTVADLRLPPNAIAVTERGWRATAAVTWDLSNLDYDPADMETIQTFTVPGTITLPAGVTNANNVPLTTTIQVTVGVDPVISIAEANAAPTGTIVTVEGYVTVRRTGDSQRIVIQDSNEPWGGLFIQDNAGNGVSTIYQYVGQWVRITGTRGVQWFNNAIHFNTAQGLGSIEVVSSENRPTIRPVEIELDELQLGVQGEWNNMLVSLTAELIERDAGIDPFAGNAVNHIIRIPGEGRIDVQGYLPSYVQNGDMIYISRAIVHWRNDLESHRLHADWAGGIIASNDRFPFTDVALTHWARNEIWFVYDHGLMTGTSATTFAPNATLSRAMVATILYRMAGEPEVAFEDLFTDVAPDRFYSEAVVWASQNDIVLGYAGRFRPDAPVTRQEFATMLYRYAQVMDYEIDVPADFALDFPDADRVASWALEAMLWANYNELITGTSAGLIPGGTANRSQAAAILMRFVNTFSE